MDDPMLDGVLKIVCIVCFLLAGLAVWVPLFGVPWGAWALWGVAAYVARMG